MFHPLHLEVVAALAQEESSRSMPRVPSLKRMEPVSTNRERTYEYSYDLKFQSHLELPILFS